VLAGSKIGLIIYQYVRVENSSHGTTMCHQPRCSHTHAYYVYALWQPLVISLDLDATRGPYIIDRVKNTGKDAKTSDRRRAVKSAIYRRRNLIIVGIPLNCRRASIRWTHHGEYLLPFPSFFFSPLPLSPFPHEPSLNLNGRAVSSPPHPWIPDVRQIWFSALWAQIRIYWLSRL